MEEAQANCYEPIRIGAVHGSVFALILSLWAEKRPLRMKQTLVLN